MRREEKMKEARARYGLVITVTLPAAAGIGTALFLAPLIAPQQVGAVLEIAQEETQKTQERAARESLEPLPDDPEAIRLAALGGRTAEARRELLKAVDHAADAKTLGGWLAVILASDPEYLERFLPEVEGLEVRVTQEAMLALVEIRPEAVWKVLRHSPRARKWTDSGVVNQAMVAPESVAELRRGDVLQEGKEASSYFAAAAVKNPLGLLKAWRAGLVAEGSMEQVLQAWERLQQREPAALQLLMAGISPEMQHSLNSSLEADAESKCAEKAQREEEVLLRQDLLGASGEAREASQKKLEGLPEKEQFETLKWLFGWGYLHGEFRETAALTNRLKDLPLKPGVRDKLYKDQYSELITMREFESAYECIPEKEEVDYSVDEVEWWASEFAKNDPSAALEYAQRMPEGEDRNLLMEAAEAAKP